MSSLTLEQLVGTRPAPPNSLTNFQKAPNGRTSQKSPSTHSGRIACRLGGGAASCGILLLVLLCKAYPANHAPRIEVAGELVLIAVARHQHHHAPIVDVLQVRCGGGSQIA